MDTFSSPTLISLSAASAGFLLVLVIWQGVLVPWASRQRLKDLEKRRRGLKQQRTASPTRHKPFALGLSLMRRATDRLNLMSSELAQEAGKRLSQAGWRSRDALVVYLFARLVLPFVLGGLSLAASNLGDNPDQTLLDVLLFALPPVLLGAYLPELPLRRAIRLRQDSIAKSLPDGLDLLVVCAQAGLSMDAALDRVAREMQDGAPELADELRLTVLELGFLPERRKALTNLASRTGVVQMESVVNTLLQSEHYGTPLAQSLRVLAAEYRNQRLMKAEEKAARLPAIMTVPMILFILPVLFVVLLGPAIINAMDAFAK
ncbi:MAG: type II secretion system F family protein [Gammaproteobacteria bacterium]|nr:type II secretion system F family protein [Gammaproteobacteria bacterium]MCP5135566.1 type II secretion system F family protein [Gammaproteobacteria bacterium]